MRVKFIDYTGFGHSDPLFAARLLLFTKNTRLTQDDSTIDLIREMPQEKVYEELRKVAMTIRSSWEFIHYTVAISEVSRAFTHQLVRTRYGVSFAQQSMRTVDMSDSFMVVTPQMIDENLNARSLWFDAMEKVHDCYRSLVRMGIPTEDARGLLPTNIATNIIMKIDLRALADMVAKRENLRAQGEYADVVREISRMVIDLHPWAATFLYPDRKKTPALDHLFKRMLGGRTPASVPEVADAMKEVDLLKETWG